MTSNCIGQLGWREIEHWMWSLFAPKWDKWRQQRLGLPPLLSNCFPPQATQHMYSQFQNKKQRLTVASTAESDAQSRGCKCGEPTADTDMSSIATLLTVQSTAPPTDSKGIEAGLDADAHMPSDTTSLDVRPVPQPTDSKGTDAEVTANAEMPGSQYDVVHEGLLPRPVPLLYGLSPHIIQQPGYWPDSVHMCGFWQQTQPQQVSQKSSETLL